MTEEAAIMRGRYLNLFCYIAVVIINILGNVVPLGGSKIGRGQKSALLPMGPAFAIWGVIYTLMGFFCIYQLFPFTLKYKYINKGVTPYFWIQALGNFAWVLCQAYAPEDKPWIQLIPMYTLLGSLIVLYSVVILIVKSDLENDEGSDDKFYINYFIGRLWISIYTSWIIAASSVDTFYVFGDLSDSSFRIAALAQAYIGVLGIYVVKQYSDVAYGLTVCWTSFWISLAAADPNGQSAKFNFVLFLSSSLVLVVVGIVSLMTLEKNCSYCVNRFKKLTGEDVGVEADAKKVN